VQAHEILLDLCGQRRFGEKLRPCGLARARDKPVLAESFLVEKSTARKAVRFLEIPVVILVEALDVNAQLGEQLLGLLAVNLRAGDGLCAAVTEDHALASLKFVATRVAAEIIVIFQDQNFGFRTGHLAEEIRRRKATDSAAYHDQVVRFSVRRGGVPAIPVAQGVADLHHFVRGAAHACEGGRIGGRGLIGRQGRLREAEPLEPVRIRNY